MAKGRGRKNPSRKNWLILGGLAAGAFWLARNQQPKAPAASPPTGTLADGYNWPFAGAGGGVGIPQGGGTNAGASSGKR